MATSLLLLHFIFFYCYCEQGNDNKLVAIAHFIFILLEAKMGNDNKFVVVAFFSVSVEEGDNSYRCLFSSVLL
jgi:hypothetical protein